MIDAATAAEASAEALALLELFGEAAYGAVQRRISLAIDDEKLDDAMFWLEVQTRLYGFGGAPGGA